jgi:RHS repeat-associated protein
MNLVDRVNRQRSLTAMSRTLRSGSIVAHASVPTTTYSYDANGNVTQAGGWSYVWDYLNRMLASGYNNSTTTYGYDTTGARVLQVSTTSTTYYPSKFFSLASTTNGGTSWATSTNYIWLGDTLLGTIDQKLYNGTATGTAISRYVHPDHLGSTNVVTDASGMVTQLLDYYPYGATRVSSSTFPTNEKRQYIGQFSDAQNNLDYLNARYLDPQRGQFLSEDPTHLAIGNQSQLLLLAGKNQKSYLADPQYLNSYSYARNNPIVNKDPDGNFSIGASYSGNLEGGFGAFSATYVSANLNLVVDPATQQAYVVTSLSGALNSGYMNRYQSAPDNGKAPFVLGIYGGEGFSGNYSPKLINPNDIQGTQDSINVNVPLVSFNVQGAGTDNPTYAVGAGEKGVASVSRYPVYTQITRTYSVNQLVNQAKAQAASYYQAAIASIQSKINAIQAMINGLKSSSSDKKN